MNSEFQNKNSIQNRKVRVSCSPASQFHIRPSVREICSHLLIKRLDSASAQIVIVNFNSQLPRIEISITELSLGFESLRPLERNDNLERKCHFETALFPH